MGEVSIAQTYITPYLAMKTIFNEDFSLQEGKTPLHIAAEAGQASMVELLLANEARGNVTAAVSAVRKEHSVLK